MMKSKEVVEKRLAPGATKLISISEYLYSDACTLCAEEYDRTIGCMEDLEETVVVPDYWESDEASVCCNCVAKDACPFAFDPYCQDGECLAGK